MWLSRLKTSFSEKLLYYTGVLPPLPGNVKKILLIRFSALGDILHTTPVVTALHHHLPDCELWYLLDTRFKEIVETNPMVTGTITIDRNRLKHSRMGALVSIVNLIRTVRYHQFDLVIDLHGFNETGLLALLSGSMYRLGKCQRFSRYCYNIRHPRIPGQLIHPFGQYNHLLNAMGVSIEDPVLKLYFTREDQQFADRFFRVHNLHTGKRVITMNLGGSHRKKRWDIAKWALLADRLCGMLDCFLILVVGPRERHLGIQVQDIMSQDKRSVILQTSIRKCAAVMSRTNLLISTDSGPLHMGVAAGVPSVALVVDKNRGNFRSLSTPQKIVSRIRLEELEVEDVLIEIQEFVEQYVTAGSLPTRLPDIPGELRNEC